MKLIYSSLLLSLFTPEIQAQEQNVVASAGGTFSNSSFRIDATLGEVATQTATNGGLIAISEGFHQPITSITSTEEFSSALEVTVFPNPSTNVLNIQTKNFQEIQYQLFTIDGKRLETADLNHMQTQISMTSYAAGQYLLVLQNKAGAPIKSIQILKH